MDIGLTVGESIERLEATAGDFEFAELSIGESAFTTAATDDDRLRDALAAVDAHTTAISPADALELARALGQAVE